MSTLNSLPVLKPKKVEITEQPKSDKELERLRKIRERIIRNRASANASRLKKKEYMESLEKKNKELIIHKEKVDKENQRLKDENENLKLQIQYLSQTIDKMNTLLNESQNKSIEQIQAQIQAQSQLQLPNNILLNNQNVYASPISPLSLIENNFTSDINSPESLNNVSFSSPVFNTDNQVISSTSTDFINNIIPDTNVNTAVSGVTVLSPQSSVGEPAADTLLPEINATNIANGDINEILNHILDDDISLYTTDFSLSTVEQQQLQELISEKELYQRSSNFFPETTTINPETPISQLSPEQILQLLEQQVSLY